MSAPAKRSGYVSTPLTAERVDAQWERIARGLPARRIAAHRRDGNLAPRFAVAFVAICALGAVWWVRGPRAAVKQGVDQGWAGSLVASDDAPMSFTLTEGTHIDVDPNSQLELLHNGDTAVTVALARGSARFDVAKRPDRRFSVRLGSAEVVVTGTQFHVSRRTTSEGERMRVAVDEGTVEIHRVGQSIVTLHRGDQWSGVDQNNDFQLRQADDANDARDEDSARAPEYAESADDGNDGPESAGHRRRRARVSPEHVEHADPATQLFEQANELRRAGELREASGLFAQLVQSYPKDRRAALSAFELGRLRMDSLGDVPGAVDALEGALKLDARRSFAEDALARLVTAHEALHERAACLHARERYLSRYPDGVHATRLATSCAQPQ